MALTSEELEATLAMLRDLGVEEFENDEFSVRFAYTGPTESVQISTRSDAIPEQESSLYHNKNLWPGGRVPKFPTKLDK